METQGPMGSLYIGDLDAAVDEAMLYDIFRNYGAVLSVKVCRDAVTRASLGYGYVNYRFQEEAEKAIKAANFSLINGKCCRIMWYSRNDSRRKQGVGNLFLKNINPELDSKALFDAFSNFGPIMSCKISLDEYGLSRGFGFVQFYDESHAEEALKRANGVKFKDKKLVVAKFIPKSERVDAKPLDPSKYTNIFVKNFKDCWDLEEMKKIFSKFGELSSACIQNDNDGVSKGFGFVNFIHPDSAEKAKAEMDGFKLPNGEKLYVAKAMKKKEREAYLKKEHERRRADLAKKYQDHNLFVKNFDESFTHERLLKEFSQFGQIKSSCIMMDEKGKSRCFGFVCFANAEDAKNALNTVNNKMIDNKAIFVAIAQRKDERKRMLDERYSNQSFKSTYLQSIPMMYPPPMFAYGQPLPARYPGGGPIPRAGARSMVNPGAQFVPNNPRMSYGYPPGQPVYSQSHPPGHRGGRGSGGQVRGHFQNTGQRQQQQQGGQNKPVSAGQVTQVAVNQVVSESHQKNKKEEKGNAREEAQTSTATFGDRVAGLCRKVFKEQNYESNYLTEITNSVVDYLQRAEETDSSDAEICSVIQSCYGEFLIALRNRNKLV